MEHGMTTRRRAALNKRQLLHLPDELLSMIILETMWECTLPESLKELPDLESYQRRLTNHPSLQPERIAFLGGICGRLRGIYQELKRQPSLWSSPDWAKREAYPQNWGQEALHTILPPFFAESNPTALTLVAKEMGYLPLIPRPTLESLTELEVFGQTTYTNTTIIEAIEACRSLKTLRLHHLSFRKSAETAFVTLLRALAPLPDLRHVAFHRFEDGRVITSDSLTASLSNWTSPITRLEITHMYSVTFPHFVRLMECFAGTLAVAIFKAFDKNFYAPMLPLGEVSTLPALERLSIAFCLDQRPPVTSINDHTHMGQRELSVLSPLKLVEQAPFIAYFDCTERLEVKTQAELDEVVKLVDREGWRRLRVKLKTWKGDKGNRWTEENDQDVVVG